MLAVGLRTRDCHPCYWDTEFTLWPNGAPAVTKQDWGPFSSPTLDQPRSSLGDFRALSASPQLSAHPAGSPSRSHRQQDRVPAPWVPWAFGFAALAVQGNAAHPWLPSVPETPWAPQEGQLWGQVPATPGAAASWRPLGGSSPSPLCHMPCGQATYGGQEVRPTHLGSASPSGSYGRGLEATPACRTSQDAAWPLRSVGTLGWQAW